MGNNLNVKTCTVKEGQKWLKVQICQDFNIVFMYMLGENHKQKTCENVQIGYLMFLVRNVRIKNMFMFYKMSCDVTSMSNNT